MGKHQKKQQDRNAKQSTNKFKHITQPNKKGKKETEKEQPKGKLLFKIIAENDEAQDAFAALGFEQPSEEEQHQQLQENVQEEVDDHIQEEEQPQEEEVLDEQENGEEYGQEQLQEEEEADQEIDQQQFVEDEQEYKHDEQELDNQQFLEQGDDADCDAPPPLEGEHKEAVDISVVSLQIQQTISILNNVIKLGQGKPRKYYVDQLRNLLHQYYGYNFELIDHFLNFFNPAQLVQFFEANETQRPLTIRTNTLKTRRKELAQNLIQRGVNLDPLAEWSKAGIKIYESKVPIGATPEYLAGYYMLQSASSFLPVLALDPQAGERILDLSAAPGGKTTYIAQLMKNTGCIFANDLKKERLKALQYNLYRLGITNTVVTCKDGRKYHEIFPGSFDRVLLDAPCTGLGIISKDHSIKANRLLLDIYKNSHIQKQLLLAAIDCAKVGGVIVYSTCSVSPLENEQVVNYALKKRFAKVVDCDIEVGQQGLNKFVEKRYHNDLKKTRRIYPHVHNMDGFYVAKLVKTGKGVRLTQGKEEKEAEEDIKE